MSLSDDDLFKPMALSSLERFDKEHLSRTGESKPDFERVKTLIEKSTFDQEGFNEFKMLYDEEKEEEEIFFKPLFERKEKTDKKKAGPGQPYFSGKKGHEALRKTPEDKGYQKGLEKGYELGIKQGQEIGYEEGLKKGEAEGFEKGEQQGFEKGEKKGLEQGLKEGEGKGLNETRQKGIEIIASLTASLKTADQTLDLLVEKYEEKIILLIQQIAQKAVMAQVEVNDEIVRNMILDALKTLVQPEEVTLSISREDYEYIEMIKEEFFEEIDSLRSMSVKSDPSIKRGGCKIDTITASVTSEPESRLEAIFEAMKQAGKK